MYPQPSVSVAWPHCLVIDMYAVGWTSSTQDFATDAYLYIASIVGQTLRENFTEVAAQNDRNQRSELARCEGRVLVVARNPTM